MIVLPKTSPYTAKDQRKADQCNKFIGRGSPRSSTHSYMLAYGALANCGEYTKTDKVFISAEGMRNGRLNPSVEEITLAANADVTFITDTESDRNRPYNVGERQVVAILEKLNYFEIQQGKWVSAIHR